MKERKYNTDDRKRQDERPNTNMNRHGQDKSVSTAPCDKAFKNAPLKSAFSIIRPGLAYTIVCNNCQSGPFKKSETSNCNFLNVPWRFSLM